MEPIVLAFGTALVGAMATSTWQQVQEEVVGLWHRIHPKESDIGTELQELREQVVLARRDDDTDTEKALGGTWRLRVQQLLGADPSATADIEHVLNQVLLPALAPAEQSRIGTIIMTGSSHDSSTFTQIGSQTVYNRS